MHDASTHEVVEDRCDWSLSGGARRGSGVSALSGLWSPGRRGKQERMGNHKAELRSTADASLSHETKGTKVNPTEHSTKTPSTATGFRALLSSLHAFQGTGASNSQRCVADSSLSRHNQGAKVRQGGSMGEGSMAEVELTRITVRRVCDGALARPTRRHTALTNIGRSPQVPWRAVKGGPRLNYPLWPSLLGVAASPGRGARPSFLRPRCAAAEPKHAPCSAPCWLPAPAPRRGAILVADSTIPMNQTALTVGTAPARRLERPAADRCASIKCMPGTVRRRCDGTLDRRASPPHHPAIASTARLHSALATSNHSDMAAH